MEYFKNIEIYIYWIFNRALLEIVLGYLFSVKNIDRTDFDLRRWHFKENGNTKKNVI